MTRQTAAKEDYLRAIYDLGRHGRLVSTTELAEYLGVAPASVTGMLKKLDALELVAHVRYAGVRLTPEGERVALEVIRHHRLIETYLAEALGVGWDEVHDEAHRLEHHISEALEDRMAAALGHPTRDPHGASIPPKNGPFEEPSYPSLAEATAGERLVVRAVADEDAARLRYLGSLGLRPDTTLLVLSVAPFDGPITVRVGEAEHALGRTLAATISVEPAAA
jgi:DtxR family Mn-dependent transcriptional regulator